MDLDKLKDIWQQIDTDTVDCIVPINVSTRSMSGLRSSKRIFLRSGVVAAVWIIFFPLLCIKVIDMPLWVGIAGSVFFAIMTVSFYFTHRCASSIDPSRCSLVESLQRIYRLERLRRIHRWIGYSMAVPLLLTMFYYFSESESMLFGGIVGAIVGFTIGLITDRRISRRIASLRNELRILSDDSV